ncbi:acyltransferase family protein [Qipengyuania sp.]|uniref:acyltransferase family protein n=1 Tax=Qipengyuania sp. TaxID=2004515 RepID=UPI0035C7ADB4
MRTRFGKTLAKLDSGRDNNFNLIRMVAASCVLVSHAFPIALGVGTLEPFEAETGFTLGWVCVAIFFAISGYLITRSYDRKPRIETWITARIVRLFPALIVVSGLIAMLYGPLFTTLSPQSYFSDPATYTYILRNVTLVKIQYSLPGVFETMPMPDAINGSLWTLLHEVACYVAVMVAGILGLLTSRRRFVPALLLYFGAYWATGLPIVADLIPAKLAALRFLSLPFAIGAAFYALRENIVLSWLVAALLALLAALLIDTPLFRSAFVLALAYATFVFAYLPSGPIRRYNALGDYSYGIYIYAFPVQQAAVAIAGPMNPLTNMLISFPVTLVCAIASWYLIEKPSLARRGALADLLTSWRTKLQPTRHKADVVENASP